MQRISFAYLHQDGYVVTDPSLIKGAAAEEFKQVRLILTHDEIKDMHYQVEMMEGFEDEL